MSFVVSTPLNTRESDDSDVIRANSVIAPIVQVSNLTMGDRTPIQFTQSDPGAMVEKRYNAVEDRYGIGQFGGGTFRMYTSDWGGASVCLSRALTATTYFDYIRCTKDGTYISHPTTLSNQCTVSVSQGTAPFVVTSTTQVANLNSQYLEGRDSAYFANASNFSTGTLARPVNTTGTVTANSFISPLLQGTANVMVSDSSGALVMSNTPTTTLAHLNAVTSSVQPQLDAKAPLANPSFTGTINANTAAGTMFVGNVNMTSGKFLDLGYGNATREGNAGKIGYGVFSGTNLDIVGAGTTSGGARNVRIYDSLNAVTKLSAPTVETPALTSTGTAFTLRVNTTVAIANVDSNGLQFFHDDATSATLPVVRCRSRNATTYTGNTVHLTATRTSNSAFGFILATAGFGGTADDKFRVSGDGATWADAAYAATGADYAEYFEWVDGNPLGEDRRGVTVVLVGHKVQVANSANGVIGVVSSAPAVIGDSAWSYWQGKYLRDDFGKVLEEECELWSWTDEAGVDHQYASDQIPDGVLVPDSKVVVVAMRGKRNPAYDPAISYVPRERRTEWTCVGLVGKLRVRSGQAVPAHWIFLRSISTAVDEYLIK